MKNRKGGESCEHFRNTEEQENNLLENQVNKKKMI